MKGLLSVAASFVPVSAWAAEAPAESYTWGHPMMWSGGTYGMIVGPLFMILVLAVVIAAVLITVRSSGSPWQGPTPPYYPPASRTALDILKERFARGEIDKSEFEDRRRVLGE